MLLEEVPGAVRQTELHACLKASHDMACAPPPMLQEQNDLTGTRGRD